jgi:predicted ATP-grasp superfamily ATP-dependent carboligase
VPRDGNWLAKPLRSGGGLGIRVADRALAMSAAAAHGFYFQQRVAGTCVSFVFVAARGKAMLLGATRQLSGTRSVGGEPFLYAGSIGPYNFGATAASQMKRIAGALAAAFDLTGLVGVDGVVNDDGFWPIEINPRYVASIEILERANGTNFAEIHAAACQNAELPPRALALNAPLIHGKAILYTPRDATFGEAAANWVAQSNTTGPVVADIPARGERIPAGQPVATLLADGRSEITVCQRLDQRCEELLALLN